MSKAITDWISAPKQLRSAAEAMRLRRASIPNWNEIARLHLAVYTEAHARWTAAREHENGRSPVSRSPEIWQKNIP
jgi:hypothetical protein